MSMKRDIMNGIILSLVLVLSNTVGADDHQQAFKMPGGLETFACKFKEGRDLDDLLVAASHWSLWAESNFDVDYNAWVLTPRFFGPSMPDIDFVWLGAANTIVDLGKTNDIMMSKGQKHSKKFSAIADCNVQEEWMYQAIRFDPNNEASKTGALDFHFCTFNDAKNPNNKQMLQDATAGFQKAVAATDAQYAHFRWWPLTGVEANGQFDFVEVMAADSMTTRASNLMEFWGLMGEWQSLNESVRQCRSFGTATFIAVK